MSVNTNLSLQYAPTTTVDPMLQKLLESSPPLTSLESMGRLTANPQNTKTLLDNADVLVRHADMLVRAISNRPSGSKTVAVTAPNGRPVRKSVAEARREALGYLKEASEQLKHVSPNQRIANQDPINYFALSAKVQALSEKLQPRQAPPVSAPAQRPIEYVDAKKPTANSKTTPAKPATAEQLAAMNEKLQQLVFHGDRGYYVLGLTKGVEEAIELVRRSSDGGQNLPELSFRSFGRSESPEESAYQALKKYVPKQGVDLQSFEKLKSWIETAVHYRFTGQPPEKFDLVR